MIRLSAHVSMLWRELPYAERPAAAAAAGFSVVETWWPPEGEADVFASEVARLGLEVASVNCDCGDVPAGDRGFLNVPERVEESLAAFDAALALAVRVGARRVNLLPGRLLDGVPRDVQLTQAAAVMRKCARRAAAEGVTIVVEPINEHDVPGYLVPTADAAVALIDAVGEPNVLLLYDAYHAARAGSDPVAEVGRFAARLGHVQYADAPGRGAPGTGAVDFEAFLAALESCGWNGPVGLEYDPKGPTGPTLPARRSSSFRRSEPSARTV